MTIYLKNFDSDAYNELLAISESHFIDLKSSAIAPGKLTKTIAAFANTSGGEIYLGIEEFVDLDRKYRVWQGFDDQEAANPIFQVLEQMNPLGNNYIAEFLRYPDAHGIILHLTIFKAKDMVAASDGRCYVRRNAQSLPVSGDEALERLRYDKGVKSFEDELIHIGAEEITNSNTVLAFLLDVVPSGEPEAWLSKQRVLIDDRPTVGGILLFSDCPQVILAKRSAVKVLRYQTKQEAERDYLVFDPITIEGPIYSLIYEAVEKVKEIIEGIEKLGPSGLEKIQYPEEALHEILTNAVLHRDYNVQADVQVRIFDNRVEIESPGRLPGHVTLKNIIQTPLCQHRCRVP